MRTVTELLGLIRSSVRMWRRNAPVLATWFLVGFTGQTVGMYLSAWLGSAHQILATLVFLAGVISYILALIMMVHSLKPALTSPWEVRDRHLDPQDLHIPPQIFRRQRALDVTLATIGPFLGIYAVWGLVENWVRDLMIVNVAAHPEGYWDPDAWSVDLRSIHLPFYAILMVVTLLLKVLFERLSRGGGSRKAWAIPIIFLEGAWEFSTFMVILMGLDRLMDWLVGRALWRNWLRAKDAFLDALPDLHLPFGWHLPDVVVALSDFTFGALMPAIWQGVGLPLVWLALTATIYGWREFGEAPLPSRGRLARLHDLDDSAWGRLAMVASTDLRAKFLPLVRSLRLIWRAGPRFMAAYLLCWSGLNLAAAWLSQLLFAILGPGDQAHLVRWMGPIDLVKGLLVMTVQVALCAAAFDRSLGAAAGLETTLPDAPRLETPRVDAAPDFPPPTGVPVVVA